MKYIKIGYIYYSNESNIKDIENYIDYINFSNDLVIKTDKPTLIIGWDLVKKIYPNVNILNKNISKNVYWTFSSTEKLSDHILDINNFKTNTVINYFFKYKNYSISPIFYKNIDLNTFFDKITPQSIFLSKDMILSASTEDKIFRFNLKEFNYFNYEIKTILVNLKNKYPTFFYDKNGSIENEIFEYFNKIDRNIIKKYISIINNNTDINI